MLCLIFTIELLWSCSILKHVRWGTPSSGSYFEHKNDEKGGGIHRGKIRVIRQNNKIGILKTMNSSRAPMTNTATDHVESIFLNQFFVPAT